jgi:hypothetical protein
MPVTHTDFAFTEESFDPTEYPDEIRPTYKSDRFPFTVPKTKVDPDAVSKTALQVRDRIAETAGVAPEQIPEGLLRAVEAADVWPDENVRNAASGRVRSISTEVGEFLVVDFWANPCVVAHDPNNGRTTADARDKGLPYLEAIRDDSITGAPVLSVKDAAELIVGIEETASALGFVGAVVDSKDLHDINWIGLQGVHEPILLTPTLVEDEEGNQSWILKVDDGNRRLAMLRRCLRQCTNLSLSEIEAWSDHFRQPGGTVSLRQWTAADVAAVRRKATYKDASNYWRPASGSEDVVQGWLDASNVVKRTVVRTSVVPARLVVGYRNLKGSPTQNSSSMEVVQRYIRRTHIKTAAQREWSDATQSMQVALDVMRRMQVRAATVQGYTMALSEDELKDVYGNRVIDWAGAKADDPRHPLRLAAKAIASFICTDMTADGDVKLSLTAHSMSTHHTKIREHRAEVAASVAMPIVGMKPNERRGGDYARARAVVDRASRHVMFGAVKRHPDGATNPWWRYLNHSVDELEKLANQEFDNGMDGAADEKGVGGYGPATRALLFLAILGLATNPAIRTPLAGEAASPWQLTLNGLGGSRGNTLTTPDLVMSNVLARFKKQGVEQLAAVVKASLAGAIPPNTIDPAAVATDAKGIAIERTRGTLTEEFLRSDALGWTRTGGGTNGSKGGKGGGTPAPPPPGDPYDAALDALSGPIEQAAASVAPFRDPESEVGQRFANSGLPANYTQSLGDQIRAVQELLLEGSFIARSRGGNSSAVFEDAGGDQ